MRVVIPIVPKPQGGGNYFLLQLMRHLSTHGDSVTTALEPGADVLFSSHWMVPLPTIYAAVRQTPNIRIAHRLDGVATAYGRRDGADAVTREVNALADLTIFQSHYARKALLREYGVVSNDGPVILNPVDLDVFAPYGPEADVGNGRNVAVVSWSTNPMKGAGSVYRVAKRHRTVRFHLAGRFPGAPPLDNVIHHGTLGRQALAALLRACDALLMFAENEACPNVVIEALATGTPVLYRPSGATPELVGTCGFAINEDTFDAGLAHVLAEGSALRLAARKRAMMNHDPSLVLEMYRRELHRLVDEPENERHRKRRRVAFSPVARARAAAVQTLRTSRARLQARLQP